MHPIINIYTRVISVCGSTYGILYIVISLSPVRLGCTEKKKTPTTCVYINVRRASERARVRAACKIVHADTLPDPPKVRRDRVVR